MAAPETISESAASILPRELLDLIVSQLRDDKATLRHCTTICKHWLSCVRAHLSLYTTFTLHCFRDDELSEPTPGLQALVSSAYSSILPYITDLTVDVHWRQMRLLEPSLALLPDSIPVRTLRLHQAAWDVLWVTDRVYITSRFSAITTLVLHRVDCPASELHIILGAFPTLENLFFSTVVWEWKNYVVGDGPINIPPNEHPGHGSLQRIHFDDTEVFPFVCWLAAAEVVPPIKSLHISLPLLEVGGYRSAVARPLAKLLSCLASTLEEFTLRHTDLPSRRSPWLSSPGPFRRLTMLRFTGPSINFYYTVLFLETIVCPALHTLEISVYSARESSEMLARLQARIRVADFGTPQNQSVKELRMLRCVRFVIVPGKSQGIVDIRAEQDREAAHLRAALPDAWERGILQFVY
ncbi:hypothetical protein C8F04DRAFT_1112570 [Mycena alexandri]|uniref:F-box domain-containing protein n=1 Tax=Mycena alexandri TaxID=1745969 RepID=A0AAD6SNG0_9AGAR|nr:hypothetical protein C8F04DRAFT_1112570 [Mycena alexandri]